MSTIDDENPIELHLFSSVQDNSIIELLTSIAYYHRNTEKINLNDTINFGRAWQDDSLCEYGFISLPYLDGPDLEDLVIDDINSVKLYWIIPITIQELNFKKQFGVEALEEKFEMGFNYIDPNRKSLI